MSFVHLITSPTPQPWEQKPLWLCDQQEIGCQSTSINDLPDHMDTQWLLISPAVSSLRCLDNIIDHSWRCSNLIIGPRPDGDQVQRQLRQITAMGVTVYGPGSQGVLCRHGHQTLPLCWSPALEQTPDLSGHIALISQGGAFGFSLFHMAAATGAKFHQVISIGSYIDDDALFHQLEQCGKDPEINRIIVCLESLCNGRKFARLMADIKQQGKTILLFHHQAHLPNQRHPQGRQTDQFTWASVAKQLGLILVHDLNDLIGYLQLEQMNVPSPLHPFVIATGQGLVYAAKQSLEDRKINLPTIPSSSIQTLRSFQREDSNLANPFNGSAQMLRSYTYLQALLQTAHNLPEVNALFLVLGPLSASDLDQLAKQIAIYKAQLTKPIALCILGDHLQLHQGLQQLRSQHIPVFRSLSEMSDALKLYQHLEHPTFPDFETPQKLPSKLDLSVIPDEAVALKLVKEWGLDLAPTQHCTTLSQAEQAAEQIGYPVALKVVSPDFAHKAEARAIALDIQGPEELRNAFGRILDRAHRHHPNARLKGVLVQKMMTGMECMIGIKKDPLFGPMVAVGLGGAYYQVTKDLSLQLAPINLTTAQSMILNLKGSPLLDGSWTGKRLNIEALAQNLCQLSKLSLNEPQLQELDINPIFLNESGAFVVDAFLRGETDVD